MFRGQFQHNLDDKNRMILPAKYRESIGVNAVITIGFEGCITIYTEKEWDRLQDKLANMPMSSADVRSHLRTLNGSASDVELDKQGRLKIPEYLKKLAGISKECVVVGVGTVIEVWSKDRWEQTYEQGKANFESVAEKISYLEKHE